MNVTFAVVQKPANGERAVMAQFTSDNGDLLITATWSSDAATKIAEALAAAAKAASSRIVTPAEAVPPHNPFKKG